MTVILIVNGDDVTLRDDSTVVDLLAHLGLGAAWVLVERNGAPVERAPAS